MDRICLRRAVPCPLRGCAWKDAGNKSSLKIRTSNLYKTSGLLCNDHYRPFCFWHLTTYSWHQKILSVKSSQSTGRKADQFLWTLSSQNFQSKLNWVISIEWAIICMTRQPPKTNATFPPLSWEKNTMQAVGNVTWKMVTFLSPQSGDGAFGSETLKFMCWPLTEACGKRWKKCITPQTTHLATLSDDTCQSVMEPAGPSSFTLELWDWNWK